MPRQLRPTPWFQGPLFAAGRQGMGLRSQHVMNALNRSQQASDRRKQRELERERMRRQEEQQKKAQKEAKKSRNLQMGLMAGTAVVGGALAAGALAPAVAGTAATAPALAEAATIGAGEIAAGTAGTNLAAGAAELGSIGAEGLSLAPAAAPTIGTAFNPGALAATQGATPLGLNAGQVATPIASASRFTPAAVPASAGPSVGGGAFGGFAAGGASRGFGGGGGGPGPARTPARSVTSRQVGPTRPVAGPPGQGPGGPEPQTGQQFGISGRQQQFPGGIGTYNKPSPLVGGPQPGPAQGGPRAGPPPGTLPYPSTLKRSLVGAGLGLTDAFSGANNLGGYLGNLGGIPGRNAALAQQMWQRGRADRQDTALVDYRGGINARADRGLDLREQQFLALGDHRADQGARADRGFGLREREFDATVANRSEQGARADRGLDLQERSLTTSRPPRQLDAAAQFDLDVRSGKLPPDPVMAARIAQMQASARLSGARADAFGQAGAAKGAAETEFERHLFTIGQPGFSPETVDGEFVMGRLRKMSNTEAKEITPATWERAFKATSEQTREGQAQVFTEKHRMAFLDKWMESLELADLSPTNGIVSSIEHSLGLGDTDGARATLEHVKGKLRDEDYKLLSEWINSKKGG